MWDRCRNLNGPNAHLYIGRNITVCERWERFENFLDDMGERPKDKSLDRINNDMGYEPGNCRWATPLEQARNTRTAKVTYDMAVQIVLRRMRGEEGYMIAKDYGIGKTAVYDIANGKRWKDARITAAFIFDLEQDEDWLSGEVPGWRHRARRG
jgi:hypothetical protein